MIKRTPRTIGLNLAFKLYVLLVMMVGPTLLIYYIYYFRMINDLHEREIGELVQLLTYRAEDWIVITRDRERTAATELERRRRADEDRGVSHQGRPRYSWLASCCLAWRQGQARLRARCCERLRRTASA